MCEIKIKERSIPEMLEYVSLKLVETQATLAIVTARVRRDMNKNKGE